MPRVAGCEVGEMGGRVGVTSFYFGQRLRSLGIYNTWEIAAGLSGLAITYLWQPQGPVLLGASAGVAARVGDGGAPGSVDT